MKEIYLKIFYFTESRTRLSHVIAATCPVSLVQCRPHHDNEPTEAEIDDENYVFEERSYFISISDIC